MQIVKDIQMFYSIDLQYTFSRAFFTHRLSALARRMKGQLCLRKCQSFQIHQLNYNYISKKLEELL